MSRHAFWPEVFYGLTSHPQWADKYASMYRIGGQVAVQDQLPVAAILRYLDLHPGLDRSQLLDRAGNLYWGAIDHYSMLALWDFVRADPWFVLESFGYKFIGLLSVLKEMPAWVFGSFSMPRILIFALFGICAAYFLAAGYGKEKASFRSYIILLVLCVPASWLPNIVAITGWELMADAIVSWFLFLSVLFASLITFVAKPVRLLLSAWIEAHTGRAPPGARPSVGNGGGGAEPAGHRHRG
jgi:hypothetical protein